jgi:Flp pilus assembly protein TadD/predicted Zn-dependent protease
MWNKRICPARWCALRIAIIKSLCLVLALAGSQALGAPVSPERQQKANELSRKAFTLLDSGKNQQGAELLWQAAALDPNDAITQYNLGVAFERLARKQDAWAAFKKAVILAPNESNYWMALASAYDDCGDKKGAIATYQQAKKRFPGDASLNRKADEEVMQLSSELGQTVVAAPATASKESLSYAAYNLVKAGKNAEAIKLFLEITRKAPGDGDAHRALAELYVETKQFANARAEFDTAARLLPNEPNVLLGLMHYQTLSGDLEGLQTSRKLFLNKFPNHKESADIKKEIAYYEEDFANTRQMEKSGASTTTTKLTFAASQMPLKVFVHDRLKSRTVWSSNAKSDAEVNYSLLVERALDQWSEATRKKITFLVVDSPDTANIECEWTDDKTKLVHSFAAGVTTYEKNKAGALKARIYLLQFKGLTSDDFLSTSLHEIGHALGLSHSSHTDDIMYFSSHANPTGKSAVLSENDKRRIIELYGR